MKDQWLAMLNRDQEAGVLELTSLDLAKLLDRLKAAENVCRDYKAQQEIQFSPDTWARHITLLNEWNRAVAACQK